LRIITMSVVAAGLLVGHAMAQTGGSGTAGSSGAAPSPGSNPATLTAPRPVPGAEGSTGTTAPSTGRAGEPSTVGQTARELELKRKSEIIDRKVRRGICVGC
jgi:hypothetical protein